MKTLRANWRSGTPSITNAALLLFAAFLIEFTRTGVGEYHHYVHGYSATVFAQIVLYLGAISLVERCPTNKWTLRIVLVTGLAAQLIAVAAPPFLSTDIYRYVWDGLVQGAGINPFRYIPADPHLSFLRDAKIYPHINRRNYAHTIYPPGSQMIFLGVTRISAKVASMKVAMLGFEAVTCFALIRCLKLLHLPPERVLLYAWHPLAIWEIASSGHVDAAALAFISLAILARLSNRDTLAGGWLGAAVLVKLYPVTLLPAFLRPRRLRPAWVTCLVVAAGYALYLSAGKGVLGFLPVYAREEGLKSGTRFFPLDFAEHLFHRAIPSDSYVAICACALAALAWWAYRHGAQPAACIRSGLLLATALILCFSPHYPWYFLWLLPFLALWPWRPAFFLALAPGYLLSTSLGAPGAPMYWMNCLLYSGFLLLLAYDWLIDRAMPWLGRKVNRIQEPRAWTAVHRTSQDVSATEES